MTWLLKIISVVGLGLTVVPAYCPKMFSCSRLKWINYLGFSCDTYACWDAPLVWVCAFLDEER